ncbi:uncharacterized protein [Dysidea avara]|uniref:uncharacterized protein n=1 Tax=Dysidea avara TaxID=196820 RepID=UPI00332A865A
MCKTNASYLQDIVLYDVCPLYACGRNESSPRGFCVLGECECTRPWYGDDCSQLIYVPIAGQVNDSVMQEAEQYSVMLTISQGSPPLTWSLVSGPPQLRVDPLTGLISWNRAQAGNHTVTVQVENQVGRAQFTWELQVIPGYTAILNPISPKLYPHSQQIVFIGRVEYVENNSTQNFLAGFVPVDIDIISNGVTRTIRTFTNTDGNFTVTFYPAVLEYGSYQAGARHPSQLLALPQAQWGFQGLKATPSAVSLTGEAVSNFEEVFYNATFVHNDGPGTLSELTAISSLASSELFSVQLILPSNVILQPGDKVSVDIKLSTSGPVSGVFFITIQTIPGTSLQIRVNFQIAPILPSFVIKPSSVNIRVLRGRSQVLEFNITNTGRITANTTRALLPNNGFISFISFGNQPNITAGLNLQRGQSAILSVLIQIPTNQQLGDISTSIAIISAQLSTSVPFRITVSSNVLMNLTVIVEDEFTYFASGGPLVNDAAITLINYQRGIRITLTTEAGNGTVTFTNIHEDRYEMFVEASDHLSIRQVIVTSVDDEVMTVFMQRQTVMYTWSVTPVTFEDNYVLTVEADFVTHVPIPIVTVTPEEIDLELFELGFYSALQINITNQGLIRANDSQLQFPDGHPFLEFTSDTTELGYIEPLSSTIVTINVSRRSIQKRILPAAAVAGAVLRVGAGLAARTAGATARAAVAAARSVIRRTARNAATSTRVQWITYAIQVAYNYVCGGLITRTTPIVLKKLVLIESPVPQPVIAQIGCGGCGIGRSIGGPTFSFNGFSARTPAFCDPCISAMVACAPAPSLPLIGCIPLYLGGSRPWKSTLDTINWINCVIGSIWTHWLTCGLNVAEMCLGVDIVKKRQSVGRSVNELVEAIYPVVQSMNLAIEVLGDETWLYVGDPLWVSNALQPTLDDSSEAGVLISTTELSTILAGPPPNRTTTEMVQRLVERLNNTLHGWNSGQLEPIEGANMASFSAVDELNNYINTYNDIAIDKGFSSYIEAYNFASSEINQLESWEEEEGVCAVVRIRIEQELAVTRTAFLARLEIENMEAAPLQDGLLDFVITNSGIGEQATHLFAIGNGSLSGSLTDGDGGWTLPSEASGSVEWLIIPFSEAAPESDRSYAVGGTLRYSLNGEDITIPLVPTVITVTPDPSLLVHYFWERFVVGDDPFTDEVENSVPFTLGVAVKNAGHGVASSLQITSGQPEIIENERGLLISFMIIGAMIGNGSIEPSLTVMFGDVPPDTTKVARWQIISSLQGEFRNYSATFENINPLGDPNLSILDELEIHELIRNVRIYNSPEDDGVLDFLVNELDDLPAFPDALYSSKTLERYNVSGGTILSVSSITATILEVRTFTNTTGWVYYRYEDTQGIFKSTALTVNGSKQINNHTTSMPPENCWISSGVKSLNSDTKTFHLHIFDTITSIGEVVFMMNLCGSNCHGTEMTFVKVPTAPTVNFNQSTYNVDESDGPAQPVLVLSNPSSTDITISVFSTDGSATGGGVDYSSGPYNVTIPAGQISVPFDVPINDDNVVEEIEEFLLTIDQSSSLNGVIISSPNVAVVNISDNDEPMVSFNQSTYIVEEDDGPVQPVLVLSNPSSTDVTISVFSTDRSATGGGVDYSSGPYYVTIPAGQISVPFDVPINDDNVFEENEEFLLTIDQSSSLNGVIIGSPNVAVVNISDNDVLIVKFSQSIYPGTESLGRVPVTLLLEGGTSNSDISVTVMPSDQSPLSAEGNGVDYISTPITATFTAGTNSTTIDVPVSTDDSAEGPETFDLTFTIPSSLSRVVPGDIVMAVGNITDTTTTVNFSQPSYSVDIATVNFSQPSYSVNETAGQLKVVLILSNASSTIITVQVLSSNISAYGAVDYDSGPYTVMFPAGVTSVPFDVPIIDDIILEQNEQFGLTIVSSSLPNRFTADNFSEVTVTIIDNDITVVSFSQPSYNHNEGTGPAHLVLVLSNPSSTVITVEVMDTNISAIGEGVDYDSGPYTVTFPAGVISVPFDVPIIDDNILEDDEDFHLNIVSITTLLINRASASGQTQTTVTIMDDDILVMQFSQSTFSASESIGKISVTLLLEGGTSDSNISVTVIPSDQSPISAEGNGVDYTSTPITATFTAGTTSTTVDVPVTKDNIGEGLETFDLSFTLIPSSPSGIESGSITTAIGQIIDTTGLLVNFTSNNFTGSEAAGFVTTEIILSYYEIANLLIDIKVVVSEFSSRSATGSGIDFESTSIMVTFNSGENQKMVNVPVTCDKLVEGTEIFNLSLSIVSVSRNDVIVELGHPSMATGVIIDSTVEMMFDPPLYIINENVGSLSPTIRLSQPTPEAFNLIVTLMDVNTTVGDDYTLQSVTVPVARNASQLLSFDINLNDDDVVECTEVFDVIISPRSWCGLASGNNAQVIIINDDVAAVDVMFTEEQPCTVQESGGSFNMEFTLGAITSHDIPIMITITDITATAGSDYRISSPLTVTIPSGELSVSFSVDIIDNTVQEKNKTLSLTVDLQSGCLPVTINGDHSFTITIIDDEELTVQFNDTKYFGTEESGYIIVSIDLLGGTASHDFNVSVITSPVTATAGVDYEATLLTATFNIGDIIATVTIPVVDDAMVDEEEEEFSVTLGIIPDTGVRVELGNVSTVKGIIQDTTRPQITTHPLTKLIEINNDSTNVQFMCMAEGALFYYWERSGHIDIPSNATGIQTNTLTLVSVLPPDAGQYRCVAVNQHGRNFSDYAILIIEVHDPVATITSSGERVNPGQQVVFSCSATGLGATSFTYGWLLNGAPIRRETEETLKVAASEDTAGDYQCTARNQYGGFGWSNLATLILNQLCSPVIVNYTGFNVTWNVTRVGVTVEVPCTGPGLNGTVRRRCKGEGDWEEFVECFRVQFEQLIEEANNITTSLSTLNEMETIKAVTDIAMTLSNLTKTEEVGKHIFAEEIDIAVDIVNTIGSIAETVVDRLQPDDVLFQETTLVIDNLLDSNNQQNWRQLRQTSPETSQSLVNSTEQFGRLLGATLNNKTHEAIKVKKNIIIKASLIPNDSIQAGDPYTFPSVSDDLSEFTGGNTQFTFPNAVLKDVLEKLPEDTTGFPITSTIVRDDSLQLPNPIDESTAVLPISPIVSIQVPVSFNTTENNPISVTFAVKHDSKTFESLKLSNSLPSTIQPVAQSAGANLEKNTTCQFYDHNLLDIQLNLAGGWSQEGVKLDDDKSNDTRVTCLTNHLTSFAVLVSVRGTEPTPADEALSVVSYIGCAISLMCLCLSIVILTYVMLRNKTKDKKNNVIFIHLNLCIALALGLIVFVSGIETATEYRASCIIVAVLLQYFFISAFCWMLCEGVMLYMMLVTVFGNKLNRRRFFFILGWGPAIPIVAISAGIVHRHYGTNDYCWIKSEDGAIAAFIVPIVTMILINCVFLGITLKVLYQNTRNTIREKTSTNAATAKDLFKAVVVLLPLLGLTWIIGILAVNNDTVAFAWIFAILNSLQGVFIFIFHVVRNKQVAKEFKEQYNFQRGSTLYNFSRRMRSERRSTSTIKSTLKSRTSQSDISLHGKKISTTSMEGSTSSGDHLSTTLERRRPSKEISEIALEDSVFAEEPPLKLKTFKRVGESIIEEEDGGSEKETNFKEDETEVNESTPKKYEMEKESTFIEGHQFDDDAKPMKDEDVENASNIAAC